MAADKALLVDFDEATEPDEAIEPDEAAALPSDVANKEDPFENVPGTLQAKEDIVAVFVVAFDTKSGNVVEWKKTDHPSIDFDGIEFKAMASGAHNIKSDYVFFKQGRWYGLSCYSKMAIASEEERGARMKSVGVLSLTYASLHNHMEFLHEAVDHELHSPGVYTELDAYFEKHKSTDLDLQEERKSLKHSPLPDLPITHHAGSLSQLWHALKSDIFVLWKCALLKKRILFIAPPPMEITCYKVYSACAIATQTDSSHSRGNGNPLFYINVADIPVIQNEDIYVACTTERIFATKTGLYDICIDNNEIRFCDTGLQKQIRCTSADCIRYKSWENERHNLAVASVGDMNLSQDRLLIQHFRQMNDSILGKLRQSEGASVTSRDIQGLGLDGKSDFTFVKELIDTYDIDVELIDEGLGGCCPTSIQ